MAQVVVVDRSYISCSALLCFRILRTRRVLCNLRASIDGDGRTRLPAERRLGIVAASLLVLVAARRACTRAGLGKDDVHGLLGRVFLGDGIEREQRQHLPPYVPCHGV